MARPTDKHTQTRRLGHTDVHTSLLSFGSAPIGNLYRPVSDVTAAAAVARALGAGIGYFDTAPHYGFGLAESRLGNALADCDARPVLSTKVGRVLEPAPGAIPSVRHGFAEAPALEPVFDYSYDGVMRSFDASQRRLGRERVDILYVHDLGEVTHGRHHPVRWREFIEGGYRAMAELRAQGMVEAIGLGANEWQVCARALEHADFDGFLLAGRYTLLEQEPLDEFLPLCAKRGVSIILGGPFNSGILATGVKGNGPHPYNYEPAPPQVVDRVARIEAVCDQWQVPLAAAALQFPAAHPQICSVLAGLADVDQVDQAVRWMNQPLPLELWDALRGAGLIHPAAPIPPNMTNES